MKLCPQQCIPPPSHLQPWGAAGQQGLWRPNQALQGTADPTTRLGTVENVGPELYSAPFWCLVPFLCPVVLVLQAAASCTTPTDCCKLLLHHPLAKCSHPLNTRLHSTPPIIICSHRLSQTTHHHVMARHAPTPFQLLCWHPARSACLGLCPAESKGHTLPTPHHHHANDPSMWAQSSCFSRGWLARVFLAHSRAQELGQVLGFY